MLQDLTTARGVQQRGLQNTTRQNMDAQKPSPMKLDDEAVHDVKNQREISFSGPMQVSTSSGFAWARRRREDASRIPTAQVRNGLEPSAAIGEKNTFVSQRHECGELDGDMSDISKHSLQKKWREFERQDSFGASEDYHSRELSLSHYQIEGLETSRTKLGFQHQEEKVEFSGPLLSQSSRRVDELLERHERHIQQAVRKLSWFQKGKKKNGGK
ncbi:Protein IMPAIRED IN BABA-INDUCED STERILITY 1 [Linum grandiflorum]